MKAPSKSALLPGGGVGSDDGLPLPCGQTRRDFTPNMSLEISGLEISSCFAKRATHQGSQTHRQQRESHMAQQGHGLYSVWET